MAQVGDDPQRLIAKSGMLWNEKKDLAGAIACVLRVASQVPELGGALLGQLGQASPKSDGQGAPEMTQLYAVLSQDAETRPAALNNWGIALSRQAKTKAGEEADRLFEEAGRKYAEALRLKPDYPEALSNWGAALYGQAKTKAGEDADRLFEEAGRKYAEALRLKPDYHEALSNWGAALSDQATMKRGEESVNLLRQARQKLLEAERIRSGSGAYNLACVEAIQGNTREAVRWLQACESAGARLSRAMIAAEKDFDRIRNQPEFVSFMESLAEN
jgi:cytochrome c-type biogenesis protein CcmH/NrfG